MYVRFRRKSKKDKQRATRGGTTAYSRAVSVQARRCDRTSLRLTFPLKPRSCSSAQWRVRSRRLYTRYSPRSVRMNGTVVKGRGGLLRRTSARTRHVQFKKRQTRSTSQSRRKQRRYETSSFLAREGLTCAPLNLPRPLLLIVFLNRLPRALVSHEKTLVQQY